MTDATESERQSVTRGHEAEQALAVLGGYLDRMKAQAFTDWAETSPDRQDRLAKLHMTGHVIDGLLKALNAAVAEGRTTAEMVNYRVLLAEHGLSTR